MAAADDARKQVDTHTDEPKAEFREGDHDALTEPSLDNREEIFAASESTAKPKWPWQKRAVAKQHIDESCDRIGSRSQSWFGDDDDDHNGNSKHDSGASGGIEGSHAAATVLLIVGVIAIVVVAATVNSVVAAHLAFVVLGSVVGVYTTRTVFGWFAVFLTTLFLVIVYFYFVGWRIWLDDDQYRLEWRPFVCLYHLDDDCGLVGGPLIDVNPGLFGSPVLTERSVLQSWLVEVNRAYILENKFRSLDITFSNRSNSSLNSGNNFLGLYEAFGPDSRPAEAGAHFLIAGSNGDVDARELYQGLELSEPDERVAINNFKELHRFFGGEGYYRLGQMYLGDDAINTSNEGYPNNARPAFETSTQYPFRNDFIISDPGEPEYKEAYINMHIAVLCDVTNGLQWERYIATQGDLTTAEQDSFQREAADLLQRRGRQSPGGFRDHCEGETFQKRIEMLTQDAVIWRFLSDNRPWPTFGELTAKLSLPEVEFRDWIGLLVSEAVDLYGYDENVYNLYGPRGRYSPYGAQGSQYYRNSPAGDSTSRRNLGGSSRAQSGGAGDYGGVQTRSRDGLPDDCVGLAVGEECSERRRDLECRSRSEAMFKLGEAYLAVGNTTEAQRQMQLAITEGRGCQSEYARLAAKRLQAFNLTCEYSETSLARISRDYQNNPTGGGVISLSERQQALRALRHYDGKIDGKYGPMTRRAFRNFQGSLGFEETGDLTPIETVYLICSAAEINDDPMSMNTLGKMYLTGLGTVQNTDAGLHWLKRAAGEDRSGRYVYRNANALFNLALAYGTGTVASSYKLCGLVENIEQADQFLVEAANLGHPIAIRIINGYGDLPSDERWENLKAELQLDAFHRERMIAVGEGCRSNP